MGGDGILMRALTSHRSGPGTIPGPSVAWVFCRLEFAIGSRPYPESFSQSLSVFLLPQKLTL